jgi:nucleotide-binding universal stress UspA family protein
MTHHETAQGFRTVVVGCDGSPQADDAVALALQLMDRRRGRLVLTHVARGLNEVAETEHADLIVLGSTHFGAIGRLGNRTIVQRLLHGAPCAVAVAAPGQRLPEAVGATPDLEEHR